MLHKGYRKVSFFDIIGGIVDAEAMGKYEDCACPGRNLCCKIYKASLGLYNQIRARRLEKALQRCSKALELSYEVYSEAAPFE
ncbi:MAG: hypothetical protein IKR85_12165 [Clostridia bacterium]|nr:hypothetical protein [Clostridia bacterium]